MKASRITDGGSSDEAQIVDEVAKEESSEQSDKE